VTKAFISIGSNIEPERHIENALQKLEEDFQNLEASSVYLSKSVGFEGGDFLNLMVSFETDLSVTQLYDYLHKLEDAEGRERPNGKAWDSRTLDLDIMLFGALVELQVNIEHPESGQKYTDMVSQKTFQGQEIKVVTI